MLWGCHLSRGFPTHQQVCFFATHSIPTRMYIACQQRMLRMPLPKRMQKAGKSSQMRLPPMATGLRAPSCTSHTTAMSQSCLRQLWVEPSSSGSGTCLAGEPSDSHARATFASECNNSELILVSRKYFTMQFCFFLLQLFGVVWQVRSASHPCAPCSLCSSRLLRDAHVNLDL